MVFSNVKGSVLLLFKLVDIRVAHIVFIVYTLLCTTQRPDMSSHSHFPDKLLWLGKLLTNGLFLTLLLHLGAHIDGIHSIYTGIERQSNSSTRPRVSAMLSCCLPSTHRLRCSAGYSRQRALRIFTEYHIDTIIIHTSSLYTYTPCITSSRSYTNS